MEDENLILEETTDVIDTEYQTLIEQVQITNDLLGHQYTLSLYLTGLLIAGIVLCLLYKFIKLFY